MIGVLVNTAAVLAGSLIGVFLKKVLPAMLVPIILCMFIKQHNGLF